LPKGPNSSVGDFLRTPWSLFISIILSASFAYAEDCKTIDVRDSMNPELQEYFRKPVDQGPIGLCYAYAASDMMSQAVGIPVSATYTGAYYSSNMNPFMRGIRSLFQDGPIPEGGYTHVAIQDMEQLGHLCKASRITSDGVLKIINSKNEWATGKFSYLSMYLDEYRNDSCSELCAANLNGLIATYLPGHDVQEVKNYARANKDERLETVLFRLMNQSCEGFQIPLTENQFKIVSVGADHPHRQLPQVFTPPSMMESLDIALERNKVVGLEYDASYADQKLHLLNKWHASSVIGRERFGGLCYYRVRNTWGKDFRYNEGILSDAPDGTFLVPRFMLEKMAVGILWLE
jgi:hypothetical protein